MNPKTETGPFPALFLRLLVKVSFHPVLFLKVQRNWETGNLPHSPLRYDFRTLVRC